MSTRYVWEKYSTEIIQEESEATFIGKYYTGNLSDSTIAGYGATGYTIDSDGLYTLQTPVVAITYGSVVGGNPNSQCRTDLYPYVAVSQSGNAQLGKCIYPSSNIYWQSNYRTSEKRLGIAITGTTAGFLIYTGKRQKANLLGHVVSSSGNTYPDDGLKYEQPDTVWYVKMGSDTIDPASIAYSTKEPYTGDTITIRVNAVSPTYGGTIYYQYSYRINGGSWVNLGSKTTSLSANLTVPANATTIQARVVASDGWGFTSTSYVQGDTLNVAGMKTYVGIDNKARQVTKMYVGVNGKARQIIAAYVGIDGKAKKIF